MSANKPGAVISPPVRIARFAARFGSSGGGLDAEENVRASAVRIGAGVEMEVTDRFSAVIDRSFIEGLGSASDYDYGQVGIGILHSWDF